MLLRVIANKKMQILAIGVFLTTAIVVISFSMTKVSRAEENNLNMSLLLHTLNTQIVQEDRGQITFHFISPLGGIVADLSIPTDMVGRKPRYEITQIGDDFMCYQDNTPQVFSVDCVPFTNIASVSYLVPPPS